MKDRPTIGIALGSGAARGLAHIGVLSALEENGIEVDCVAGSSAGALIGSVYCCGIKPERIRNIASQIDRKLWMDVTIPKKGFIKGDSVEEIVRLLTRNRNIEELEKKLAIVATDLRTAKKYIFREGPIYKAVRASISIPGVFIPVKHNDMLLVDGGVIDRVPATIVKDMGVDIVLAVDVGFNTNQGKINNIFDIILQSIDVMAKQILSKDTIQADVLIEPDVEHIFSSRFDMVDECYALGYQATIEKIDDIKKVIENYKANN